jgi:hypothetical protein
VIDEPAKERRPAGCVGLFGLFALRLRSVISNTGTLVRSSFASKSPPGFPRSASAARTASVAAANGGRFGNIRPNVVGLVETVALRAATARGAVAAPTAPENATAPAPAPACLRKARLLYRDGAAVSSTLISFVSLRHRPPARRPCGGVESPSGRRAGDPQLPGSRTASVAP